jgi:diketogulonate reductase-like aldo/keto reductase
MTASADIPTLTLNTGAAMPQIGFGVFQIPQDDTAAAVGVALRSGYRSIDTAAVYRNEAGVGRARAIGVSNFQVAHLERLLAETDVVPALNQIELHPYLPQERLRRFHAEHGILTEAWSPLAKGELLSDATIGAIAQAHGRTPAQVVLRGHLQLGNVVIPKSATPERIASNIDVFAFELSGADMERIAGLQTGRRVGPDPDAV